MGQFLTLIGLAALIVAGIGVGNGVSSYLARKRDGIATLKVLGATSADIARVYFLQIGLVALIAVAAGLAAGALLPVLGICARRRSAAGAAPASRFTRCRSRPAPPTAC